MKIEVKKIHIRNGIQSNACYCPIALALHAKFGDRVFISVESKTITIAKLKIPIPDYAQNFIAAFDACKASVGPFTLEI